MATLANERHLRYILLLAEGGTDILLELLKRVTDTETQHSGKTVNDLLKDNERILKQWTDKKQREKIFSASGTPNINDWDISLLGTVILQLYGKWLTSNECENIKKLKTLRNKLAAHPPTLSMDAEQYETARKELSSILIQLSNTLDYRVHDRCQMLINMVTTGPIDIQTAVERVTVDKMLLENIQRVSDRVKEIAGKGNILSYNDGYPGIEEGSESYLSISGCSSYDPVTMPKGPDKPLRDVDVEQENAELFHKTVKILKNSNRKTEVIMLIGKIGAGKSALINTIQYVLTGDNYQIAPAGSGKAQSVTLDLLRYENCGISESSLEDENPRHTAIKEILPKLPHIVDCIGLGDDDCQELRETLELLVGGFIESGTNIESLLEDQKKFGVGYLSTKYPTQNPDWTVTKIAFLQSCRDVIPNKLIECLNSVLKMIDPKTKRRKYTPKIFLLITKYDLVQDSPVYLHNTSGEEKSLTVAEFQQFENDIAVEFNIVGALESNRIRWANYCDRITEKNLYIDNMALKFLKRMVQPGRPPNKPAKSVVGLKTNINLYIFRISNALKRFFQEDMHLKLSPVLVVLVIVFAVIAVILYKLLSVGLGDKNVSDKIEDFSK